jgi:F0F1-type ATP synthase gamma subunit
MQRKRGEKAEEEEREGARYTIFRTSYYTQLAVGLLFPSMQKIFDLVKEGDFERAHTLFIYFVNIHPPEVRDKVLSALNEEEAEEQAVNEVEEMFGNSFEVLQRESTLYGRVMQEYRQRKARYLLLQGTRALGEAWARHGLVWFGTPRAGYGVG